jgi:hypothetical protein
VEAILRFVPSYGKEAVIGIAVAGCQRVGKRSGAAGLVAKGSRNRACRCRSGPFLRAGCRDKTETGYFGGVIASVTGWIITSGQNCPEYQRQAGYSRKKPIVFHYSVSL